MKSSGETESLPQGAGRAGGEKRQHSRCDCQRVTFFATHDQLYEGLVRNISLGGVYIESNSSFYPGEKITVAIPCQSNPDGVMLKEPYPDEEVKMKCVVVWKDPDGFGLRFIHPK